MNKIFQFIIFLFVFVSQVILSQQNYDYGLKFGISGSNFKLSDIKPTGFYNPKDYYKGNSINPTLGIFLDYELSKQIILESELSYLQKGTRFTEETIVSTFENPDGVYKSDHTISFDIRYMEFSLNIKPIYKFGEFPTFLIIGTSFNYTLNAINLLHKKLQEIVFSYKFGFGTEIKNIISLPIFLELKYIEDLSNFYEYEYGKFKNYTLVFSIGIKLK